MFTWAKELLSPSVQTGKPVSASDSRQKLKSEDGEMTEEGFVCVGKSSFYASPNSPVLPIFNNGPSTLYPALPHRQSHNNSAGTNDSIATLSVPDHNEFVLRIPFTIRSGLTAGVRGGNGEQSPHELYIVHFMSHFKEKYEYDFNLERGVIREMNHQASWH